MKKRKKTEVLTSVGAKKSKRDPKELEIELNLLRLHPEPKLSAIPLERNFFYHIKLTENERTYSYEEFGVGKFYAQGLKQDSIFFRREYVFIYDDGISKGRPHLGNPPDLPDDDGKFVILNSTPSNIRELLVSENSVICSTDKFTATPVELQDNTLLGRLDNIIQSIDQNELWSMLLKDNDRPARGSIRFNEEDDCFEGYDGEQWRAFMWGE